MCVSQAMLAITCFTGQVSTAPLFFSQDCLSLSEPFRAVMWCSVKTSMYELVQRADRACAWRKQAGLLSTDLRLELLLPLPSNSTAHLCCPSELSQLPVLKNWHVLWLFCHTGGQMQIDWFVFFSWVSFYCWLAKLKKIGGQDIPLQIWEVCT